MPHDAAQWKFRLMH